MRMGKGARISLARGVMLSAVLAVSVGALAACGGSSIPTATVTGKDYSFTMPDSLPNGLVDITFKNQGKQPHQINIARLNKDVTEAKLKDQLQKNMDAALGLVSFIGGVNTIDPGGSAEATLKFTQGQYVALCFVSDPSGKPHFMDGMEKFFTVNNSDPGQQNAPSSNATVTLKDFSIGIPSNLNAGTYTWEVTNKGPQTHEMDLLKLAPGKSLKDVTAFFDKPSGQPPFSDAGGMGALAPNNSGWVKVTLQKGDYVALCFVPDIHTGKPHYMEGMATQFAVK